MQNIILTKNLHFGNLDDKNNEKKIKNSEKSQNLT